MTTAPTVLHRTGHTWMLTICWVLFAALAIVGIVDGTRPESEAPLASLLILTPVVLVSVVLAIRTFRSHIRIEEEGVLLRGLLRTHRVTWAELKRARVQPTNDLRLLWVLAVERSDGSVVRVDGIANYGPRREPTQLPVGRMAEAINDRLSS